MKKTIAAVVAGVVWLAGAEPRHQDHPTVTGDFTRVVGKVKPMHAVGQPPVSWGYCGLFKYLKRAGIPYARLHDVGGWLGGGLYVDIPNIFRDFDADETKPESYDFKHTDNIITNLMAQGVEPFYRLGVTIENFHKTVSYRIHPPKDFAKWARVCEHIVRHYREGWADGFTYDIKYWEIWNEPDCGETPEQNAMWSGTKEQYFEMYDIAAKHLKRCFGDRIKVGGPATCGFYAWRDPENKTRHPGAWETRTAYFIQFTREFLAHVKAHGSPLDFFSWHTYSQANEAANQAVYCQKLLDEFGFGGVEHILNEWNPAGRVALRGTPEAAAKTLAFMLALQRTTTAMLCFYDARIGTSGYGGLFNPDTFKPYLAYHTFVMFNRAYRLGGEVATGCDAAGVQVLGATDGARKTLILANATDAEVTVRLELKGAALDGADVLRIDADNRYTLTGEDVSGGELTLPAYGCAEVELR